MKKINIEEKTKALNEFRMNSQNRVFTRPELVDELKKLGFNSSIIGGIIPKFPFEVMGNSKLYSVPREPIHKSIISGVYQKFIDYKKKSVNKTKSQKENALSEEQALSILSAKGYQIRKCIGFDLERFQKENPVLYRKYLKYEVV